jgi:nitroimidazol reductase NimA-like FMN-containing flavoprotein (pyridoxamine 5'-phosphate oxidase superfamily)
MTDLMENAEEKCVSIIIENRYLDIATSKGSKPWVSAVYYAVDSDLNFYFVSRKDSRHGRFIQENPDVAVSIWNSTKKPENSDGIQIDAEAAIVPDEELEEAVHTMFSKRFEDEEKQKEYFNNWQKYSGDSEKKLFKIETKRLYKLSGAFSRAEIEKEKVKDRLKKIVDSKGLGAEHHERVSEINKNT